MLARLTESPADMVGPVDIGYPEIIVFLAQRATPEDILNVVVK
jgi:hypothetical protein